MKKASLLIISVVFLILQLNGQIKQTKPPLDTSVFDKWSSVQDPEISNNGNYASYVIDNLPLYNNTLVIQALNSNWKKEVIGVERMSFTEDSRTAIFVQGKDTLCLLKLGSNSLEYITKVNDFKLFKQDKIEWLIYSMNTSDRKLMLRNMKSGKEFNFEAVSRYQVSKLGNSLLLERKRKEDEIIRTTLSFVILPSGEETVFWNGMDANNFTFDEKGNQMAFMSGLDINTKSIWLYKVSTLKAFMIANNKSNGLDSGYHLKNIERFSSDGSQIFIKVQEPDLLKPDSGAIMVDIWSYTDSKLQSMQLHELVPKDYVYALNIRNDMILRLQHENEQITILKGKYEDLAFIRHYKANVDDAEFWNSLSVPTYFLVFLKTGEKRELKLKLAPFVSPQICLSPNNQYLLLSDEDESNIYSYELKTGLIRNLTNALHIPSDYDSRRIGSQGQFLKVSTWMSEDAGFLLCDRYDIWQLDPSGNKSAICLTKEYGRKNKIIFRLMDASNPFLGHMRIIHSNEKLILTAFDISTKENGFYQITMGSRKYPQKIILKPYLYYTSDVHWGADGNKPLKAVNAQVWLINQQSASQSPNLFFTKDFKNFTQVSHVYPEKNYNWMTSEVMSFKTLDGRDEKGVLYKPENFDINKKYPIIFHYYERLSDRANAYHKPDAISDEINIPWFVSNGYVVFTPDFHYTWGATGESILNTVIGAAKCITKLHWIDSTKMGLQGHSFGGYETNYIVTHSNVFACAMSSSGLSDLIGHYNSLWGDGESKQVTTEGPQIRMGETMWQIPNSYMINSPVFFADKVTTPLLMMNNKLDGAVDFSQGVEFFTALRRLGKRVWMLQYDGSRHSVSDQEASIQHTIRLTQFFNHYLKGYPAPIWMTRGIEAKYKGIKDGLEYDTEIRTPGIGLLKGLNN